LWHLRFIATARSILPEEELLELFGRTFVTLHERAAERAGKRRWADKTPENVVHLSEWQRLLGDRWVFLHVVRHPLDTLASIKEARFPRTFPPDLEGRIALYRRYTQTGLDFGARCPDRCHRIRYETLVQDPEACLRELMHWLDEAFEPGQLAFNDAAPQSGLEDPKIASTIAVHADSVCRWASVLTADEARQIRHATADLWAVVNPAGDVDMVADR
jgi:hypothetical protein